jgi:predicted hotdog family 3-hydroxylacyl-ACP dehydratase
MLTYNIEQVVPHRGAMRWVDRVLDWDGHNVTVELTVPLDGPFHQSGGVPVWIGLEYMAQAIAAWSGCRAHSRGEPPKIGFLLGTRRYDAKISHFAPGATLCVQARCELFDDNGLGMFACRILGGEQVLASANVSVYQPDDVQAQKLLAS